MSLPRKNTTWQELELGASATLERVCSEQDLLLFAHASGNRNPLNLPEAEQSQSQLPALARQDWAGAGALLAGIWLVAWLASGRRLHRLQSESWFGPLTGRAVFEGAIDGLFGLAGRITQLLETGSLQRYVAWLVGSAIAVAALGMVWVKIDSLFNNMLV